MPVPSVTVTVKVTCPGAVPTGGVTVRACPIGVTKDAADAGTETIPDKISAGESSSGPRLIVVVWPMIAVKTAADGNGLALADAEVKA